MIFGVIYWMFPIITRAQLRGNVRLGWASDGLLNVGLLLRVVGEPLVGVRPETWFGWLLAVSALLHGWVVQLTMSMAFWILPRYWQRPHRPNPGYATIAFVLLNLGIWLVVAGTTFRAGPWVALVGRLVEVGAVLFFTLHAWKRIVAREGA